jgi:hypothetical protein
MTIELFVDHCTPDVTFSDDPLLWLTRSVSCALDPGATASGEPSSRLTIVGVVVPGLGLGMGVGAGDESLHDPNARRAPAAQKTSADRTR